MPHPRTGTRKFLHYLYNTVYVVLCFVLIALILVTPGDAIRQTYFNTLQYTNIIIIAIAYLVAVLTVLFIYSIRLYVTRTVLASIPKNRIPIEKGDVKKAVREMIARDLGRSAAIAWQARPKVSDAALEAQSNNLSVVTDEDANGNAPEGSTDEEKGAGASANWLKLKRAATVESELGISLPPTKPVWGEIEHPGWGSPESSDLANIQYDVVLAELPNLIEGKAMSLAPSALDVPDDSPSLDPEAVAVLQRTGNMGMRSYVGRLVDLGVLEASEDVAEFLDIYERARFSTKPIPVAMFRRLMHLFAELLRSTKPLTRDVLDTMRDMDGMYSESDQGSSLDGGSVRHLRNLHEADIDDDAPQNNTPTTPARSVRTIDTESSLNAGSSIGSRHDRLRPRMTARNSSGGNTWTQYGTAPTTPKSRAGQSSRTQRVRSSSRSGSARSGSSGNSFAQTRRPYTGGSLGNRSQGSLRSASQASEGSVIRLARHDEGGLPYVLRVSDTF